jgi:hypothetical protein
MKAIIGQGDWIDAVMTFAELDDPESRGPGLAAAAVAPTTLRAADRASAIFLQRANNQTKVALISFRRWLSR